tara:strand:+ start:838 stop:1593 length:756 start_codon:yes stop_codon:yes gene_type:complete
MAPRGLKKVLKQTATCKLVGKGQKARFQTSGGTRLRGVTKRLDSNVFSGGTIPASALRSDAPAGGHWRGPGGGRRRGSAVDAQVCRLAGVSAEKRSSSKMLALTRLIFAALECKNLEPIMGQRGVSSELNRIGTAADLVCYDRKEMSLVVVELKCGFSGWRTCPAREEGKACNLKGALKKAADNTLNRHMAQLALTHHLFCLEKKTLAKLGNIGIGAVNGLLLYANDSGIECYELKPWWIDRASRVLAQMR